MAAPLRWGLHPKSHKRHLLDGDRARCDRRLRLQLIFAWETGAPYCAHCRSLQGRQRKGGRPSVGAQLDAIEKEHHRGPSYSQQEQRLIAGGIVPAWLVYWAHFGDELLGARCEKAVDALSRLRVAVMKDAAASGKPLES